MGSECTNLTDIELKTSQLRRIILGVLAVLAKAGDSRGQDCTEG
jgi:hypothetical protein